MLNAAMILALSSAVAVASAPSTPKTTGSPATVAASPAVVDSTGPAHAIVQFPWTRYAAARKQSAIMEAEISSLLDRGPFAQAASPRRSSER